MNFSKQTLLILTFIIAVPSPITALPSIKITNNHLIAGGIATTAALCAGIGGYIYGGHNSVATLELKKLEQQENVKRAAQQKKDEQATLKQKQDDAVKQLNVIHNSYKRECDLLSSNSLDAVRFEAVLKAKYNGKQFPYLTYYKKTPLDIDYLETLENRIPEEKREHFKRIVDQLMLIHEKTNFLFGDAIRAEELVENKRNLDYKHEENKLTKAKLEHDKLRAEINNCKDKDAMLAQLMHYVGQLKENQTESRTAIADLRSLSTNLGVHLQNIAHNLTIIRQKQENNQEESKLQTKKIMLEIEKTIQKIIQTTDEIKKKLPEQSQAHTPAPQAQVYYVPAPQPPYNPEVMQPSAPYMQAPASFSGQVG